MRTAKPSASVIPLRPPYTSPAKSSSRVKAVSRNAVLNTFMALVLGARSGGARLRVFVLEFHFPGFRIGVHDHLVARLHVTIKNFQRQRILDQALDGSLHRPRAVGRIVPLAEQ